MTGVLLDTHLILALLRHDLARRHPSLANHLTAPGVRGFVSSASLWEIAIKTRLGKLEPGVPLDAIAHYLASVGLTVLSIDAGHAVAGVEPEPDTRDPFDRLLLAQCKVEGLTLMTMDTALVDHPLALKIGRRS